MKNRSSTISYDIRLRVFFTLVFIMALSIGTYFYAVLATVRHAVAREALVSERTELAVRVSELEYQDIALRNTVNIETAISRGFSEVRTPLYVSRTPSSLTLNTQGAQ